MSTEDYNNELEDPETEPEGISNLRNSRDEAVAQAQASEQRAIAAERTMAFQGAGINMENPVHSMFASHYEGDANPEAVRSAYTELGLGEIGSSTVGSVPARSEGSERNVALDVGQAFTGSIAPAQAEQGDPMMEAMTEFREQRRRGVPEENAAESVVQGIINGVLQEQDGLREPGRFVYDREKFHQALQGG